MKFVAHLPLKDPHKVVKYLQESVTENLKFTGLGPLTIDCIFMNTVLKIFHQLVTGSRRVKKESVLWFKVSLELIKEM